MMTQTDVVIRMVDVDITLTEARLGVEPKHSGNWLIETSRAKLALLYYYKTLNADWANWICYSTFKTMNEHPE
jgi:hypothetical protein